MVDTNQTIDNDWSYVKKVMHKKTTVIFDDYYNDTKLTKNSDVIN